RELLKVFNRYSGDQEHLPMCKIREAFNSMGLYPSNSQVFLGGSCNPTTWREDSAIPFFKKRGITFYNPQVQTWRPELMELEAEARQTAELMFFVIDNQTRAIVSMLETAYLVAGGKQVIVVLDNYSSVDDTLFHGEKVSTQELDDIYRGRKILIDLLERNSVPVFLNINTALQCASVVLTQGITVRQLGVKHGAQPTMYGHLKVGEMILQVREAFNSVDTSKTGKLTASDVILAYKSCSGQDLSPDWLTKHSNGAELFSFEDFCCIITEHQNMVKPFYQRIGAVFRDFLSRCHILFDIGFSEHSICSHEGEHHSVTVRDVYLGGSCGDSHWRQNIAIPLLRKSGLSYANPMVSTAGWEQRLIPIQVSAREKCKLLLYIITDRTRSISSMIEAGYYIGKGCRVVLCVKELPQKAEIGGEIISEFAQRDYSRGRSYLTDLASREGVPIFDNIIEAVECAINIVIDTHGASHITSTTSSPQRKNRSPTL
ncbi:hypothetical protein FSP39_010521, partial [Pinctada imbricata]